MKRLLAFTVLLALLPLVCAAADQPTKVVPEDLFKLALIDDAQISHDGKQVAFVVTRLDGRQNKYLSTIWVVPTDASHSPRQLTRGESDTKPRWSPNDTTLAFVRLVAGKSQIYSIHVIPFGGEARSLTAAKDGATDPLWSHDGARILYRVVDRDEKPKVRVDWRSAGTTPEQKFAKSDVRTITRMRFESNGVGYTYDRRMHLWVMNGDGSQPRQLTTGAYEESNPRWSPDDATIAYNAYYAPPPRGFRSDLYTIPSAGGAPSKLPMAHFVQTLVDWSPDGKRLWFTTITTRDEATLSGLASANADGTDERQIVPEEQVRFGDRVLADLKEFKSGCMRVGPQDRWLVADVSVPGATSLLKIDAATGTRTILAGGDREIADCSLSLDGSRIAYVASDGTHPDEVFALDVASGTSTKLSGLNDAYAASHALAPLERHVAANSKGQEVEYWVMRPPGAVAGRRYPALIDIHGGPAFEFGNTFFHELQVWAARGYVVAFGNPRGSVGYGYSWAHELDGNWGDPMFDDVTAITDDVVRRDDVDSKRMVVAGGSYGGYAVLWIVGHSTRYKAAIAERAISNLFTQELSSDYGGSDRGIYSWGDAWTHRDVLWRQSPIAYVKNVRTPLLILHSERDTRTPVDQTYEEYNALKILQRPVWLIEFPRENHDLSRTGEPIHRVERLHILGDWITGRL